VVVAAAGAYANHLLHASDRQPSQHLITQNFKKICTTTKNFYNWWKCHLYSLL